MSPALAFVLPRCAGGVRHGCFRRFSGRFPLPSSFRVLATRPSVLPLLPAPALQPRCCPVSELPAPPPLSHSGHPAWVALPCFLSEPGRARWYPLRGRFCVFPAPAIRVRCSLSCRSSVGRASFGWSARWVGNCLRYLFSLRFSRFPCGLCVSPMAARVFRRSESGAGVLAVIVLPRFGGWALAVVTRSSLPAVRQRVLARPPAQIPACRASCPPRSRRSAVLPRRWSLTVPPHPSPPRRWRTGLAAPRQFPGLGPASCSPREALWCRLPSWSPFPASCPVARRLPRLAPRRLDPRALSPCPFAGGRFSPSSRPPRASDRARACARPAFGSCSVPWALRACIVHFRPAPEFPRLIHPSAGSSDPRVVRC